MRREQQAKRKQAETEENRSCKGVACFSLVEADLNPSAQRGILKPVQSEQRALDTIQFSQCERQAIDAARYG